MVIKKHKSIYKIKSASKIPVPVMLSWTKKILGNSNFYASLAKTEGK